MIVTCITSIGRIVVVLSIVLCTSLPVPVFAGALSLETQVVKILAEEAVRGPVKAGLLEIRYTASDQGGKLPVADLQMLEKKLTEQFTASLIQEIRKSGKRDAISIVERDRLDVIFKEKKLQVTGLTERTAPAIGGLAGLDVILLGTLRGTQELSSMTVKVLRVKDGEILGIAGQVSTRRMLIDTVTDLHAHSSNGLPLHLQENGIVTVLVNVEQGNAINISLMTSADYDKLEREKKHKQLADFEAEKTKRYSRSAYLVKGEYVLVLIDKALGVVSHHNSDVRVTAYFEPE